MSLKMPAPTLTGSQDRKVDELACLECIAEVCVMDGEVSVAPFSLPPPLEPSCEPTAVIGATSSTGGS